MPTINELYRAVETADLATIQYLVGQEAVYLNALHPAHQTRVIDVAARAGHLEIIDYLYTQGASLDASQIGAKYSLLYWVCRCEDVTRRLALIEWLKADDRYQQLNDGITLAHLAAAAGEAFENTPYLHSNLPPFYYAAIANNPNLTDELLLPNLNFMIQAGHDRGLTLAWHLAYFDQCERLQVLAQKWIVPIHLNIKPLGENDASSGQTLAWVLAFKQK